MLTIPGFLRRTAQYWHCSLRSLVLTLHEILGDYLQWKDLIARFEPQWLGLPFISYHRYWSPAGLGWILEYRKELDIAVSTSVPWLLESQTSQGAPGCSRVRPTYHHRDIAYSPTRRLLFAGTSDLKKSLPEGCRSSMLWMKGLN